MKPDLKKKLLERMFSSTEYMQQMAAYFDKAMEGLHESLNWFDQNPPTDTDWESWHIADKPEGWRMRAVPNLERLQRAVHEGIDKTEKGENSALIRTACNNIMALSRDMDVLGEKWWDYVPEEVSYKFWNNLGKAEGMAANIWRTVGDYWRNPESILKETITGPIDEQELMKYLKPGESIL